MATPGRELEDALAGGRAPVLAIKGVRIGDFHGKNLSTLNASSVRGGEGAGEVCFPGCVGGCAFACARRKPCAQLASGGARSRPQASRLEQLPGGGDPFSPARVLS